MSVRYDLEEALTTVRDNNSSILSRASAPSKFRVSEYIRQESVKQLSISLANVKLAVFDGVLSTYTALTHEQRVNAESWLDKSVLQSDGRDMKGIDGQVFVHSYDTYATMLCNMIDRVTNDSRNKGNISRFSKLNPVEKNSSCPVHPYGRVVAYCECGRPIGRHLPVAPTPESGCECVLSSRGFLHPGTTTRDQTVYVLVPHVTDDAGACNSLRDVDSSLKFFGDNMPMFARLARLLFSATDNLFVAREVLGGPFSSYLQVAVMIAVRFSISDTCRVVHARYTDVFVDDVISGVTMKEFAYLVVKLRCQGHYRGWMNNIVQNAKRQRHGQRLLSDEEYKAQVHGAVVPVTVPQRPSGSGLTEAVEEPKPQPVTRAITSDKDVKCRSAIVASEVLSRMLMPVEVFAAKVVVADTGDITSYERQVRQFAQSTGVSVRTFDSAVQALAACGEQVSRAGNVVFKATKGTALTAHNIARPDVWTPNKVLLTKCFAVNDVDRPSEAAVSYLAVMLLVVHGDAVDYDHIKVSKRIETVLRRYIDKFPSIPSYVVPGDVRIPRSAVDDGGRTAGKPRVNKPVSGDADFPPGLLSPSGVINFPTPSSPARITNHPLSAVIERDDRLKKSLQQKKEGGWFRFT